MTMSRNLFDLLKTNNLRQVKLVLESQCDVNCRNDKKETPLMVCMVFLEDTAKRKETIRLLKKKGADSNLQNSRGQTALIYSCALNQPDSAAILLEDAKLDVNLADIEGNTALTYACASNNDKMARLILEKCAAKKKKIDFARENVDGLTALNYASINSDEKLLKLFASHGAVSQKDISDDQKDKGETKRDKKNNLLSMIEELQNNSGQTQEKSDSETIRKKSLSETKKTGSSSTPRTAAKDSTIEQKKSDAKQTPDSNSGKSATTKVNDSQNKQTAPPSSKTGNDQPRAPNSSPVPDKKTPAPSAKRRPSLPRQSSRKSLGSLPRQNSNVSKSLNSTPRIDAAATSNGLSTKPRPKSRMKSAKRGAKEPTFRRGYIESQGDDSETDEEMDDLFASLRECAQELKDLHASIPDSPDKKEKVKKQPKLQEKRRRGSKPQNQVQLADMVKTYNTHPKIPEKVPSKGVVGMKKQNLTVGRAHLLPPPDAAPKFRETRNTLKPDTNTSDPTQPINVLARTGHSPFLGESTNRSSGPKTGSSPFSEKHNGEDDQPPGDTTWPPFGNPLPNIPKLERNADGNFKHPAPNKNVGIPLSRPTRVPASTN